MHAYCLFSINDKNVDIAFFPFQFDSLARTLAIKLLPQSRFFHISILYWQYFDKCASIVLSIAYFWIYGNLLQFISCDERQRAGEMIQ